MPSTAELYWRKQTLRWQRLAIYCSVAALFVGLGVGVLL